jgi:putative ABC transport system permease protein
MIRDYLFLSFDNLKHRGIRSWLTMLGIFIGIAAVVALISLGQGLQQAVLGQFDALSADRLIIQNAETGFGPPGSTAVKKLNDHDLELIKRVPGVEIAVPRLIRMGKVEYNKVASFKYMGDLPDDKSKVDMLYETMNAKPVEGRLLTSDDRGKIVLGNDFLNQKEFGKKITIGTKLNINGKDFEVAGILGKLNNIIFNSVIIMPTKDMKDLLNIGDEWDTIAVKVVSKDRVEQVARDIEEKMRRDRNLNIGEEDFTVQTPNQALSAVNTILNIVNLIVIGIAAISLIVGGIGIMNTMYTSVLERKREIGIMKAVGAKNSDILTIFLIESGLLGLTGGVVGAIIGLALAFGASATAAYFIGINLLKVTISYPLLISAVLFSLIIGAISGILPAKQASQLKPVEALRG